MCLSSSVSLASLFTSESLIRVISELSSLNFILAGVTHWRSNGGSSMVPNAADCSGSYFLSPMDSRMASVPPLPYFEANVLKARKPPPLVFITEITFPSSGVQ
ncbi:hypothetical protein RRG08_027185 [Elysia crispata]|uniref:Uncharacterized protein n=1 Tax=Elysia crispata TaxID=231223 RepID=A0AAE1DT15_9GAST|nr:hypothetical protein RRG08_027185 [Elysia crispata]